MNRLEPMIASLTRNSNLEIPVRYFITPSLLAWDVEKSSMLTLALDFNIEAFCGSISRMSKLCSRLGDRYWIMY